MAGRKLGIEEYEWTVYYQGTVQQISNSRYRMLQSIMFIEIWNEREHKCEVTNTPLPSNEPRTYYFHHILEKRNYELYSLCKWNIIMLDWLVHDRYERKNDTVPELVTMKQDLINKLQSNEYTYDGECLWRPGNTANVYAVFGLHTIKTAYREDTKET